MSQNDKFQPISENEFFHGINVMELHDGITSLLGIHVNMTSGDYSMGYVC